jgi:hypothetical protein
MLNLKWYNGAMGIFLIFIVFAIPVGFGYFMWVQRRRLGIILGLILVFGAFLALTNCARSALGLSEIGDPSYLSQKYMKTSYTFDSSDGDHYVNVTLYNGSLHAITMVEARCDVYRSWGGDVSANSVPWSGSTVAAIAPHETKTIRVMIGDYDSGKSDISQGTCEFVPTAI